MSKADNVTITPAAGARRLRAIPATTGRRLPIAQPGSFPKALNPRIVRFPRPIPVQFARPVDCGRPVVVSGLLVANHARPRRRPSSPRHGG